MLSDTHSNTSNSSVVDGGSKSVDGKEEQQRLMDNPFVAGFLVFSAFRAVYGTGISW